MIHDKLFQHKKQQSKYLISFFREERSVNDKR